MRLLLALVLSGSTLMGPLFATSVTRLESLGEARIPGGTRVGETPVGGLSGIAYDASRDLYLALVDDPSARGPARFFELKIDLDEGRLRDDAAEVVGMTVIQSAAGGPMPRLSVDPEGIVLHPDGTLYISSEGQIRQQVDPFVRHFARDGHYLGDLPLAARYRATPEGDSGPRHNLVFESLTATPDGRFLFAGLENALVQDGSEAALEIASPSRLLKFDLESGELVAEFLYWTEPVAEPASVPEGLEVNGLVELLALDENHLLALERSFSMGAGNTVRLFQIRLEGAADVQAWPALREVALAEVAAVDKELLLDLAELETYLDNVEGMTFGPPLQDGRRTLILVSDDNFNPLVQTTQILAFALGVEPLEVEKIQGAGHRSPLEGQWVRGIEGVITGSYPGREAGFWMESTTEDDEAATSRGVLVLVDEKSPAGQVGDRVAVAGRVLESQRPGELSTTTVQASKIEVLSGGEGPLPRVVVGRTGLRVPSEVVDDDGLRFFEPGFDGLDFWESLEGVRVALDDVVIVGPTNRYGDLAIDASGRLSSNAVTPAGGILMLPGDLNPERLVVDYSGLGEAPAVAVGDRFAGRLNGIVGYRFGMYRLYVEAPVPRLVAADRQPESTTLAPIGTRLTLATFNVLNLSARSREQHFQALAQTLTVSLGGPDIVAVQEIQDDTGPKDDGTVTAAGTLRRLIAAVGSAGGPEYEFCQVDPVDNQDGGQPGSNIRQAFLFNPRRVALMERGQAGAFEAVRLVSDERGIGLSSNPGRISPEAPAFQGDESRDFSASRKPLVAEFQFGGRSLFVVNNHWSSKRSDDPVFGEVQPPARHSEDQRSQQARWVANFVAEILALDPAAAVVVLGDLNEHEFRTPLRILAATPLENLVFSLAREDRYSFNFRGNSQLLDHILVSRSLFDRAEPRIDIVHVNSDLAHAHSSSDHDPIVVQLDLSLLD